jgi:transposase InsO family protein
MNGSIPNVPRSNTYRVAVQDLCSRRIVGWSMQDHMRAELVTDALETALDRRRPAPGRTIPRPPGDPPNVHRRDRLDGLIHEYQITA